MIPLAVCFKDRFTIIEQSVNSPIEHSCKSIIRKRHVLYLYCMVIYIIKLYTPAKCSSSPKAELRSYKLCCTFKFSTYYLSRYYTILTFYISTNCKVSFVEVNEKLSEQLLQDINAWPPWLI